MPARLPRASMGHAVLLTPSISFRLPLLCLDRRFRSGRNYPPKSFPVISFADPHPLTPLESYRFINQGGEGCPSLSPLTTAALLPVQVLSFHTFADNPARRKPLNSFSINRLHTPSRATEGVPPWLSYFSAAP